ncbi:MAG: amidohydrolase [Symbiobacteriaceae bacterium]|nr:amidohydrolase [Symbiobacteriaceae bacterium]
MNREEVKAKVCAAIDAHRDEIMAIGESIFADPELGYKEFNAAAKVRAVFEELGLAYRDQVALTGVVAPLKGRESTLRIAVMGELDAVVAPGHRCAHPLTGAAHSCGHNAQIAALIGVAYGLVTSGAMEELNGDVVLMAVPAEEYVEIEYRNKLRNEGKITFLGGKQEFVHLGEMDEIDMMIMHHLTPTTDSADGLAVKARVGGGSNGFVGKLIRYLGKEAHAGGAPHMGVNALNAALLGMMAIHAQRETFQDKDHIRVHPIMTKGGDLVNVIPADVRLETYVRGATMEAILDASKKVNRALESGAMAVGAECQIIELPGYLPLLNDPAMTDVMYRNLVALLGADHVKVSNDAGGGSTDAGDISYLMPTLHPYIGGAEGIGHSENYEITDRELAYIVSAKALAMAVVDLLAEGAELGLRIKNEFKPTLTKEGYLAMWDEFVTK